MIKRQKLEFRFDSSLWLLIIFVSYLFISTTIQFQLPGLLQEKSQHWSFEENPIFKSIMLIRLPILKRLIPSIYKKYIFFFNNYKKTVLIDNTYFDLDLRHLIDRRFFL